MMIRRTLGYMLLLLLGGFHASAQQQQELCLCLGDSCDVFEVRHVGDIRFADGFIAIGRQAPYAVQRIDSIVFRRPQQLTATELGWWGDLDEGPSRYEVRVDDRTLGFVYRASYRLVASGGVCQEAACEIMFGSAAEKKLFMDNYGSASITDEDNNPYIYVKETLTGPRKFELWVMSGPVLPMAAVLSAADIGDEGDTRLRVSLAEQLTGRPMTDVQLVIEGWIHNPLIKTDNPTYEHPNE